MEEILSESSSSSSSSSSSGTKTTSAPSGSKKVVIRTHSPVVYYYPSMLIAFYAAMNAPLAFDATSKGNANLFLACFFFNTLVVLFDFSTYRSVFITLGMSVLGLTLWNLDVLPGLFDWAKDLHFQMNGQALYAFGFFLLAMMIGDFVWAHLNRWVFAANEVKHIRFLVGEASMPGRGLSFRRKITDIFEYFLGFGAGTILLRVGKRSIRLNNVIRAQSKIAEIERFIRTTGVYSDDGDVFDDFGDDFDDDF
jgi:hypothetical protein